MCILSCVVTVILNIHYIILINLSLSLMTSIFMTSIFMTSILINLILITSNLMTLILMTLISITSILMTPILMISILLTSVLMASILMTYRVSRRKRYLKPKKEVFFTKSYHQRMKYCPNCNF